MAQRLADEGRCREARAVLEQRKADETVSAKLATLDEECHLAPEHGEHAAGSEGSGVATRPDDIAASPKAVPPLPISLEPPRRVGLGVAVGASSDADLIGGVRALVHLVPAGSGEVRAIGSAFYGQLNDAGDPYHHRHRYTLGGAIEYAATIAPQFTAAAGIGAGFDIVDDNYESSLAKVPWLAVRVSPTLRYHAFDLGLHFQLVYHDRLIVLGEVGIDFWIW